MEEKGASPEEIARAEQIFASPVTAVFGALGSAITVIFVLLVQAALIYFMASLMLGAQLTFGHCLTAVAYGAVVGILDTVLKVALSLAKGTLDVRFGLGNLLGEKIGIAGRFIDRITDPLLLWSGLIVALAIAAFARRPTRFGVQATVPAFLLVSLLLAVLSG